MIQLIEIPNPFEPRKHTVTDLYYHGGTVPDYADTAGRDVYLNGNPVEAPEKTYPQDGDQIIVMPHVAGKGVRNFLGIAAMIALSVYAGNVAGGLWKGAGVAFKAGHIGAMLASGAIMFIGGKIINSIFPQQDMHASYGSDRETSQSYGWDLPTPQTMAGYVVGETYGEAMPAPQVLEQHVETVNDKQYLNLLYCGGYGPVDSIDDIRIDRTDIGNFSGVELETRLGTNDQEPISFFKNTPVDQSVGVELDEGSSVIRTSDSTTASSLEVTLEWPGGLFYINDSNEYANATVRFTLEYRLHGETAWESFGEDEYSATAASNSAVRRTYSVSGLEEGQYDVRVTLTDRPHTTRYQTTTNWTLMTSYSDGIYSRPGKVLIAMRILASNQLSNGIPSVNWRQRRSKVYVYDPEAGHYVEKAADNPIWAAYDILHHCRRLRNINTGEMEYVVDGVPASALSVYFHEWEEAAAYADELITNQDGEEEPRFRFDAFFDTTQKRMTAAQKAANIGHAAIIPHGRNYGIKVDKPGHITQIFGEGRTTVSSVSGAFSSKEDRARAIEVTYNDSTNDFKNTVITVRSPSYSTDSGSDNTAQLTLFGVKRRSQAYREAITALATNERQIQTLELSADIDAIVAEYGDIIGYSHAVSRVGIASGRLVGATETTVTLDKEVTISAGGSYEIYIQMADDNLLKKTIVAADYTGTTLTVAIPFAPGSIPAKFDNYAFGETDKAVKPYRIISAARDGDMLVSLKLAEYDEAIYATELDYSKYPVIDYTTPPVIANVTNVTAVEQSYANGSSSVSDVLVSWELTGAGRTPDSYLVEIVSRNSAFSDHLSTRESSCLFHNVKPGETYDVIVHCVFDAITIGSAATVITIHGAEYEGGAAYGFSVTAMAGGFYLSWIGGSEAVTFTVHKGAAGAAIEDCALVFGPSAQTAVLVPETVAGLYQFYVTPLDAAGEVAGSVLSATCRLYVPSPVTGAAAYYTYRHYVDGFTGYDIVVTYRLPVEAYAQTAMVYYKTNHVGMNELGVLPEGALADELGFETEWKFAGEHTEKVVIPAAQVGDKYQIKIVTRNVMGICTSDAHATYLDVEIVPKTTIPDKPQNFAYDFTPDGFTFTWDDVSNSDIDFYELRLDNNPGAPANLLGRYQGTTATVKPLASRTGTVYLFAHNATKKYSVPATLTYEYSKPDAPALISFEDIPCGSKITVSPIPEGCHGLLLKIAGKIFTLDNNIYSFLGAAGIYAVSACYVDLFGEGYWSSEFNMTVRPTFDPAWIADESISMAKVNNVIAEKLEQATTAIEELEDVDEAISQINQTMDSISSTVQRNKTDTDTEISQINQTATEINSTVQTHTNQLAGAVSSGLSTQISQTAQSVTSIVTELGKSPSACSYSAITQLQDAVNLRVQTSDYNGQAIMNQINLTPTGTTIDGKYLHITGTTQIDNNVIVGGMIAANSITADKLSSSTISLTNHQGIQGGAVTLDANGMKVQATNGTSTVFDSAGMSFKDVNGRTFSAIGRMMIGEAQNGQHVTFGVPWDIVPQVLIAPVSCQSNAPGYNNSNVYMDVRAANITTSGFDVICRPILRAGSDGSTAINRQIANNETYTLPIASAATRGTISVTLSTTSRSYWGPGPSGETATLEHTTGSISVELYINGVSQGVIFSQTTAWPAPSSSNEDGSTYATTTQTYQHNITFSAGATISLKAIITNTGTCTVNSVNYNVSTDTVISTDGRAMFIAIGGNNSTYTVS